MSQIVKLGDQRIEIQDFNALKFLEAMDLLGQIMEIVPRADEEIARYTQQWISQNGSERVVDRASARWLFGADESSRTALESITDAEWEASGQTLKLSKAPDGNAAMMRAFPAVYKHARPQVENVLCLLATPNSKLEEADDEGKLSDGQLYAAGGAVHATRKLVLHRARMSEQIALVIASMRQLMDEFREADLGGQMGELREAATMLSRALTGKADDRSDMPDADAPDERADTSPEPSSSTSSSPPTPASPAETFSTASPTAS